LPAGNIVCIHVRVIQHFMSSREVDLTEEEKLTLKAEGLAIPTTLPLTKVRYLPCSYSLIPRPLPRFKVARRKERRPGRRNHVRAIAQSLCTQRIEPYTNCTDSTNNPILLCGRLCYWFRGVIGSTRVVSGY
jgi:hypothetical protein